MFYNLCLGHISNNLRPSELSFLCDALFSLRNWEFDVGSKTQWLYHSNQEICNTHEASMNVFFLLSECSKGLILQSCWTCNNYKLFAIIWEAIAKKLISKKVKHTKTVTLRKSLHRKFFYDWKADSAKNVDFRMYAHHLWSVPLSAGQKISSARSCSIKGGKSPYRSKQS